jgi:hypothetical protein
MMEEFQRWLAKNGQEDSQEGGEQKSARKTKVRSYNPQIGQITGRELQALQRLDTITKKYQAEGMSVQDARPRVLDELRNNPRRDRRKG